MSHTKESIAKMLATRAANKAAKRKAAKNGNAPNIPGAIGLLMQVARKMPKRPTDLSLDDLDILRALRVLTHKAREDRAE